MSAEFRLTEIRTNGAPRPPFTLGARREVTVGRGAGSDLQLDDASVSRAHARLTRTADDRWSIEDLGSTNGTYVNARRLQHPSELHAGDQVRLGEDGPLFVFEVHNEQKQVQPAPSRPGGSLREDSPLTRSKVVPIFALGKDWWTRPYVIPAVATFITYIALIYFESRTSSALQMLLNQQDAVTQYVNGAIHFGIAIGFYIGFLIFYLMMDSTGRQKPWWMLGVVALATALLVGSPLWNIIDTPFIAMLGGERFNGDTATPLTVFASIVQIGLPEELAKAIPLFILAWLTTRWSPATAARIGLRNPLDGIIFAMASALGFTFLETFTEYAPGVYHDVIAMAPHSPAILGFASTHSLQVLIERIVQSLAGHLGFSGYFGYMIGLAILNKKYRWQYLLAGWAGAAILHGFWDAIGVQSLTLSAIFAALTILMLIAAIRRSRQIEGLSVPLAAVRSPND